MQTLSQLIFVEQMNKTILKYDKSVRDAQISFYRIQNDFNEYYPLPQVQISPINNKFKFILGLNLICSSKGNMLINSNYVTFFKRTCHPNWFCLFHRLQSQDMQLELHAECDGTSSSYFKFPQDLEIENPINREDINSFLEDLEGP